MSEQCDKRPCGVPGAVEQHNRGGSREGSKTIRSGCRNLNESRVRSV